MHLIFADDAKQASPSRLGMGPLVATGGLIVPAETCGQLEMAVNQACADAGFPDGEKFKWSPGRKTWMRSNLVEDDRRDFFLRVLGLQGLGKVTIRPHCPMPHVVARGHATALVRAGARLQ